MVQKSWEPDEETKKIVEQYGHLINNTGGNDPIDLLRDLNTKERLSQTNVVVFTLAVCVQSQVGLLRRLQKEGLIA